MENPLTHIVFPEVTTLYDNPLRAVKRNSLRVAGDNSISAFIQIIFRQQEGNAKCYVPSTYIKSFFSSAIYVCESYTRVTCDNYPSYKLDTSACVRFSLQSDVHFESFYEKEKKYPDNATYPYCTVFPFAGNVQLVHFAPEKRIFCHECLLTYTYLCEQRAL